MNSKQISVFIDILEPSYGSQGFSDVIYIWGANSLTFRKTKTLSLILNNKDILKPIGSFNYQERDLNRIGQTDISDNKEVDPLSFESELIEYLDKNEIFEISLISEELRSFPSSECLDIEKSNFLSNLINEDWRNPIYSFLIGPNFYFTIIELCFDILLNKLIIYIRTSEEKYKDICVRFNEVSSLKLESIEKKKIKSEEEIPLVERLSSNHQTKQISYRINNIPFKKSLEIVAESFEIKY